MHKGFPSLGTSSHDAAEQEDQSKSSRYQGCWAGCLSSRVTPQSESDQRDSERHSCERHIESILDQISPHQSTARRTSSRRAVSTLSRSCLRQEWILPLPGHLSRGRSRQVLVRRREQ